MLALALSLTRSGPAGGGEPSIVMNPLPATAAGTVGNTATWLMGTRLKGPNADKYAISPVLSDNDAVVRIYEAATATLLETQEIRAGELGETQDDHSNAGLAAYADGSLIAIACGHNTDTVADVRTRDPAGNWTSTTLTYPDTITYPSLYLDANETLWFFIRSSNLEWYVRKKPLGGAWSSAKLFFTAAEQCYCSPRYDPSVEMIFFSLRYNGSNPAAGALVLAGFDCATQEFVNVDGGLGFFDGTASANAKTLPFELEDLPLFEAADANRVKSLQDQNANYMVVIDSEQSGGYFDNDVYAYSYDGSGDRFDPANWTKGVHFTSLQGKGGTSTYGMNIKFAQEPHTGLRMYTTRRWNGLYQTEQWDNPTGAVTDLSAFRMKRLNRTNTVGDIMFRAFSMLGAAVEDPIFTSTYTAFSDFNTMSGAEVVAVEPWRGGAWPVITPGFTPRAETLAWTSRHVEQPNQLWMQWYDQVIGEIVDAGTLALEDAFYILCAHTPQAMAQNVAQDAYNLTYAGGFTDAMHKAGVGVRSATLAEYLNTGFNTASASGRKYVQNSNHIFAVAGHTLLGGSDVVQNDSSEIGNTNSRVVSWATSGFSSVRCAQTSALSVATDPKKASLYVMGNRSSSNFVAINVDGISSSAGTSSAAPSSETIHILGRNGNALKSGRVLMFAGFGSSLTSEMRSAHFRTMVDARSALLELVGPTSF